MSASSQPDIGQFELTCPACGYDLRAATSDLCPECGLAIKRDSLKLSGFPWAHRGGIGRLRAYLQTAWLVLVDSKSLRHEAARNQDPTDARPFARFTAIAIAAGLLAIFAAIVGLTGGVTRRGLPAFAVLPPASPTQSDVPNWLFDLLVPWSAGAVLPPVLPLALTLFALALTAAPRAVFRVPASQHAQRNALAIANYATAPLALLLPALVCFALAPLFDYWANDNVRAARPLFLLAEASGAILLLISLGATALRLIQWLMRTRHAGLASALLGLVEILVLWLLAALVFLFLLPWCVGYIRIVIDSFG